MEYVIVERDGVKGEGDSSGIEVDTPTATVARPSRRSNVRRQEPSSTDVDYDSDDDDDDLVPDQTVATIPTLTVPSGSPAV